jgi:hypothetical protein
MLDTRLARQDLAVPIQRFPEHGLARLEGGKIHRSHFDLFTLCYMILKGIATVRNEDQHDSFMGFHGWRACC